ncbi:MAG: LamG domain-containing protein [Candidatus Nealsonbacteria bacterium]|nr:LamG domain-containing protein [Candidatus Nealsonbacteria bacterium]
MPFVFPALQEDLVLNWHGPDGPTGIETKDASGGNHIGTFTNMDPSNWAMMPNGWGLALDGLTEKVEIPDLGDAFDGRPISCWAVFKLNNYTSGYPRIIDRVYNGQFAFYARATGVGIACVCSGGNFDSSISVPLALGVWYQVLWTYDGARYTIYANGRCLGSSAAAYGFLTASSATAWIGNRTDNTRGLDGEITDVALWSRALLAGDADVLLSHPDALVLQEDAPLRFSTVARDITVWTEADTIRYKRDQAAGSGTTVALAAAGNETRGFQVLLRSTSGVSAVNLTASALTGSAGTIAATNVWTYRAHQLEVVQETYHTHTATEGTGWYPGPLIPARHPVSGDDIEAGATYQAFPYTLPANQTHTLWVEVRVPSTTAAGTYTGTVTVSADGQDDVEIDVTLTVAPFGLPMTAALRTNFGGPIWRISYGDNAAFAGADGWGADDWTAARAVGNTIMSNHRLSALDDNITFRPYGSSLTWAVSSANITAAQTHIDAYHPSVFSITRPAGYTAEPITSPETEYYDAWIAADEVGVAAIKRPDALAVVYLSDEPYTAAGSDYVALWGPALRASDTIESLVVHSHYQVADEDMDDLESGTNIWVSNLTMYSASAIATLQADGNSTWLYTALTDSYNSTARPFWALDFPVLHYRVMPWMAHESDHEGILYWAGSINVWPTYRAGSDPWTEPVTYGAITGYGTISVENGSPTVTGSGTDFAGDLDQYIVPVVTTTSAGRYVPYRIDSIDGDTITLSSNYAGDTESGLAFRKEVYNHEGVLFLPATDATVGYNGVVETLALKALAVGVADFDYMALATS